MVQKCSIESGRWVRIASRYESLKIKVLVTKRVFGKKMYLGLYSPTEGPINVLTSSHADNATNTPAYKETAVKTEVLPVKGSNPLKPINPRFSGKPMPQNGAEMERQWARKELPHAGYSEARSNPMAQRRKESPWQLQLISEVSDQSMLASI